MILYKSTRGDKKLYKFSEIILKGIARDGGLFVPTIIPKITSSQLESLVDRSYQEVCLFICDLFQTDIPRNNLEKMIYKAYSSNYDNKQIVPLVKLKDNQYILELWHGPTSAFKDMALQIMPYFFAHAVKTDNQERKEKGNKPLKYMILVATSGDTGKAALEGYKNKENISVMVFYPDGGVSKFQELSMTTQEGGNVAIYAIKGNFDDAQKSVKEVFADEQINNQLLEKHNTVLSSANSINWGRILPQIIYHISSYLTLVKQKVIRIGDVIDIAVPTGNFGNILAAFYAKKMGLPIRKLICASNENNVLTEFLRTGIYDISKRKLIKTPSPSMDIIVANNIERLLYEITNDQISINQWMRQLKEEKKFEIDAKTIKIIQDIFYADWVSNEDCLSKIKRIYNDTKYLMDPHTAVAWEVTKRYKKKFPDAVPVVICSTAHWAKFPKDVYKALTGFETDDDEFALIQTIKKMDSKIHAPRNILDLKNKKVLHKGKIQATKDEIEKTISQYLSK